MGDIKTRRGSVSPHMPSYLSARSGSRPTEEAPVATAALWLGRATVSVAAGTRRLRAAGSPSGRDIAAGMGTSTGDDHAFVGLVEKGSPDDNQTTHTADSRLPGGPRAVGLFDERKKFNKRRPLV